MLQENSSQTRKNHGNDNDYYVTATKVQENLCNTRNNWTTMKKLITIQNDKFKGCIFTKKFTSKNSACQGDLKNLA